MTKKKLLGGGAIGALAISIAGVVGADIGDDEQLIVNGEIEMIIETAAPEHLEGASTRSTRAGCSGPTRRRPCRRTTSTTRP
jgi:hypothetical protein